MRDPKAQTRATNEFQRSNSTTNAFLGSIQKAWMTGQLPKAARDLSTTKVSKPKPTSPASKLLQRTELAPEMYEAAANNGFLKTAFGFNFDRGRYPAQRPRHGDTNKGATKSTTALASESTPPVLSPPAPEENSYTLPATSLDVSTNAENVLPSPSPSVEARQDSVNAIDVEDEVHQPQAAAVQPVEVPTATLEEFVTGIDGKGQFEKLLKDAGKSNYGPTQIAVSAIAQEVPMARSLSGPHPQWQNLDSGSQSRSESAHSVPAPSIARKRPHEIPNEPQKRLQSLPGSLSSDSLVLAPADVILPSHNFQGSTASSPAGNEMHTFARCLAQRRQQVINLPNRKGSHVERPRLDLLREACENLDHFYLVLHQLYCFEYQDRKLHGQVLSLSEIHRKGLDVVAFLLVSNKEMADDAIAWFSTFPLPWKDLLSQSQSASAHDKVLRCLEKMAKFWGELRSRCTIRKFPPLVDELVVHLNIDSFLFQQIIFRALLRDIWSGRRDEGDGCFLMAEETFRKDYQAVMGRSSSGSITAEVVSFHQQTVIEEYRRILGSHWQHIAAGPTAKLSGPVQQESQSRLVPAKYGSRSRNKSQPENNKNNRSPLTLDLNSSGPPPIATQATQTNFPGNLLSQSQALCSNPFPSPQVNGFAQSPTTLQGLFTPGVSMNSRWQWNNQQQQGERRTSSTTGNIPTAPEPTHLAQQTPHVLSSNVPRNPHTHHFQQTIRPQQQSLNQLPSLAGANSLTRPQSEARRSFSNQANEPTLSILNPHPSILPSSSLPKAGDSLPFLRSYPPLPSHPNPVMSALHQAHLRSPTLSYLDPSKNASSTSRCYRVIRHVLMPPKELDSKNRHVNWEFGVNRELIDWFARDAPGSHGAPPTRGFMPGSRLCRIRCINLKDKVGMPSQSEWVVADNVWPGSTAVVLNGTALDIRKKTHHGKDLPIDVTRYIKAGQNNLSAAVIGFPKDSTSRYTIGVEFIEVKDEQQIKSEIKSLPWLEARKRILGQAQNLDPDIEVIQAQRVLDLTDPFTARIFKLPVRGVNCHHNQCFDCDTFLETRSAKFPGEPCGPDEFRCPICGQDARPESLMVDEFFLGVRTVLNQRQRLDAKAVILDESGEWTIKEEEEATGEAGDGTGRRSAGLAGARPTGASTAGRNARREIIELDDE